MASLDPIRDLLPQAQLGSSEALGEVLEACRTYLVMIAESDLDPGLRAKGGASDLVQQTFLEAQQDFSRFQGKTAEELRAWLRQILKHNVANFARAYRGTAKRDVGREMRLEAGSSSRDWRSLLRGPSETPSQQFRAQEQLSELDQALARLPAEYQQLMCYRYQDGLSFDDIAQRMNRSAAAVRKLWCRAVERLRAEMVSQTGEDRAT